MENRFFSASILGDISNKQLLNLWNEYREDVGDLGKLVYPFTEQGLKNLSNAPFFHNENDEFDAGKFAKAVCGLGCIIGCDDGFIAYNLEYKSVWFRENVNEMISDLDYPTQDFCNWLNEQDTVKIVYSHYYQASDMTFFTKNTYHKGELQSTECIGFLHGEENVDDNLNSIPGTKAEYK